MTRKRPGTPTLGMQIECLFRHFPILCHICKERILWEDDKDWDHWLEYRDVHEHSAKAIKPVHREPCHRVKSGKAESVRHHIDRLEKERKGEPKRKRPKKPISSRGFQKGSGRKLQSHVNPWGRKRA